MSKMLNAVQIMGTGAWPHRSGWPYVWKYLSKVRHPVVIDDFVEQTISRVKTRNEDWIGFFHLPPNVGFVTAGRFDIHEIFKTQIWIQARERLKCSFAFSEYQAQALRQYIHPVAKVYHPTETPELKFEEERYLKNDDKCVYQIGYNLRNIED